MKATINDVLLAQWPFGRYVGVPVWHLHESLGRLTRLSGDFIRVAFGSSQKFSSVGTGAWWARIAEALRVITDASGRPVVKLHGLRMLNPNIFSKIPFSSADSTNVARNIGIDKVWDNGHYTPASKGARGVIIAERIEAFQSAAVWAPLDLQQSTVAGTRSHIACDIERAHLLVKKLLNPRGEWKMRARSRLEELQGGM